MKILQEPILYYWWKAKRIKYNRAKSNNKMAKCNFVLDLENKVIVPEAKEKILRYFPKMRSFQANFVDLKAQNYANKLRTARLTSLDEWIER